jgi:hypothetical protein
MACAADSVVTGLKSEAEEDKQAPLPFLRVFKDVDPLTCGSRLPGNVSGNDNIYSGKSQEQFNMDGLEEIITKFIFLVALFRSQLGVAEFAQCHPEHGSTFVVLW